MIGCPLTKTDMKRLVMHMGDIEQPWVSFHHSSADCLKSVNFSELPTRTSYNATSGQLGINSRQDRLIYLLNTDRPEYIKTVNSSTYNNSRHLRMPMKLFNVRLPLMYEQQLRGQFL